MSENQPTQQEENQKEESPWSNIAYGLIMIAGGIFSLQYV